MHRAEVGEHSIYNVLNVNATSEMRETLNGTCGYGYVGQTEIERSCWVKIKKGGLLGKHMP